MLEPDSLSLVTKRADFITELAERPLEKREMVTELDYSRATVNRAIRALEDAGLVRETPVGFEPTLAATVAVETYREFLATERDVLQTTDLLAPLDHDAGITPELLRGADRFPAETTGTYANFERVRERLNDADVVDVVVPSTRALSALDHWQNALVAAETATVLLADSLYEDVRGDHRSLPWLAAEGVDVLAGDTPRFVLVRARGNGTDTAFVLVYDDEADGFGALRNDSPAVLDWATEVVESSRRDATAVVEDLTRAHDPGSDSGRHVPAGGDFPRTLESEGFRQLSEAYFQTHSPRDLATALRTGLTIADVMAGHAIERATDPESTAGTLAGELLDQLDDGEDCAIVGQPGAGKSTVCKTIACEWYDSDRGPVLYRESGHGKPFESLASLRAYLRETEGDVLVVAEDAVRPEANAVLELAAEYADSTDVRFLVDARTSDWRETRLLPVDATVREYKNAGLSVSTVSPPDASECTRLVERYEAETGTSLDVTGEQLLERIDDASSVSGEMFLLAHHICLHADPLSSVEAVTPTPLVEDVQNRIASLQRDASNVTMGAALLTQFLNVAELPVHEEFLQAQTTDVEDTTTDAVLSALADRQLVVDDDTDGLRTPHNQWSRVFLTEALDVLVDAPERLGTALSNVLDLTNAAQRSALDVRTRNSSVLQRIASDPTAWADDLAERLFEVGEELPALSAYYGTFENPTFALEDACSEGTVFECGFRRARSLSEAGDLDAAESAFRTVIDAIDAHEDPERFETQTADCVLGLGSVRGRQGDLDGYGERAERALELHRANGNEHGVGRCYIGLGHVAHRRNEYERSKEYNRRAAELFDEIGDLKRKSKCLGNISASAIQVDDYETADEYAQRSLAIRRDIGTEYELAQGFMLTGRVAEGQGRFEDAMQEHRRALVAADTVGGDEWQVVALNNMANVALQLGRLDEAEERFSRASERNQAVGDPQYDAIIDETLSEVWRRRGDVDRATEHARAGLEEARTAANERLEATVRTRLGQIALDRGDHETAREELAAALESFRELGVDAWRLTARIHLARVELDVGALDRAAEHAASAGELLDVKGGLATDAWLCSVRGKIRMQRGDVEGARAAFEEVESFVDDVADTYVQAVVHRDLGAFARRHGDGEDAVAHFETSQELAADIGAEGLASEVADALESVSSREAEELGR